MPLSMSTLPQNRLIGPDVDADFEPSCSDLHEAIAALGARLKFTRNTVIYRQGQAAHYFHMVERGMVRSVQVTVDGRRQVGGFYLPGEILGLEGSDENEFSAEAITDATVLVARRSAVLAHAKWNSEIARLLWTATAGELRRAHRRLMLSLMSAQERVIGFLLEMAERHPASDDVELPMTRQDIADYLGLKVETVSRTLTSLAQEATIERATARRIVLRNCRVPPSLSRSATYV